MSTSRELNVDDVRFDNGATIGYVEGIG